MPDPDEGRFQSPLSPLPLPEQFLTRRRLLAGAGALATAGVAELVPIGGIAGWEPAPDTWPLAQYDLSNTAGTDAPVPTGPSVAWTDDGLERRDETALVVGPDRVYVGGDGLAALGRRSGERLWRHEGFDSGVLALHDGTLYSATTTENFGLNGEDAGIGAFDARTGERSWLTPLPTTPHTTLEATSLLVADGTVLVGHDFALSACDAGSGRRRFVARAANGGTYLAVHDGDLYVTGRRGAVTRYRSRDLLDVPLSDGPATAWRHEPSDTAYYGPPAATGDRLHCARADEAGRAALLARRRDTGAVEWRALPHPDAPGDPPGYEFSVLGTSPAVRDGTLLTGVEYGGDDAPPSEVVAVGPTDGSVRWRDSLGRGEPAAVALAGGTALVAVNYESTADTAEYGEVRAYDPASGEVVWRVGLPDVVVAMAPVGGTVFVADHAGVVHALR